MRSPLSPTATFSWGNLRSNQFWVIPDMAPSKSNSSNIVPPSLVPHFQFPHYIDIVSHLIPTCDWFPGYFISLSFIHGDCIIKLLLLSKILKCNVYNLQITFDEKIIFQRSYYVHVQLMKLKNPMRLCYSALDFYSSEQFQLSIHTLSLCPLI